MELVDAVWTADVIRNGFAIVRPPGHHAESQEVSPDLRFNCLETID
jgi:acetoin utilization deacetylase AcuC-like enzyme